MRQVIQKLVDVCPPTQQPNLYMYEDERRITPVSLAEVQEVNLLVSHLD